MGDLVRGEIVEHERRRENKPPREREYAGVPARARAAGLVADANALDGDTELGRVAVACRVDIPLRLALEEITDAPIDVRRFARDAKEAPPAAVGLGPHRATLAAAMYDAVRLTAQRHLHPMRERRGLRQALEPRRDPAAVLLCELFCFPHAAAWRHRKNHLARRRIDAQRVAACLAMTSQAHQIDRFVKDDLHDRGLARTAIQQRAKRHRRKSTLEQPRAEYCHSDHPAKHDSKK